MAVSTAPPPGLGLDARTRALVRPAHPRSALTQVLDLEAMAYRSCAAEGGLLPRSGHTAHLLPTGGAGSVGGVGGVGAGVGAREGAQLSILVLGGRDYRPPATLWQDGEHLGGRDVHVLSTLAR